MSIQLGDHLKTPRSGYSHHGLYVGADEVIHYSGKAGGLMDGSGVVSLTSLSDFTKGARVQIVSHSKRRYGRARSVKRARERMGEQRYSVHENNCEHFVHWCIHGKHRSSQVDRGAVGAGSGFGTGAGVTTAKVVSGRGGSWVMGSLKNAGKVVRGGAARGVNVAAGVGALGGDLLMSQTVLKDNDALDDGERKARKIGRWSGRVAGFGASCAASSAVSAAAASGTAGGAAISSGLAAVGGTLGGGMAAGLGVTVGAPLVLTVGIGYGAYKWSQK